MEQSYSVLVVDDSPFIFKAVKKALEPEGFEFMDQAFNGRECLEKVAQQAPDIIILDITMPVMDGLETATHLFKKNPATKLIMISAMGDEEMVEKARRVGVKNFLVKPFKPEELQSAVRKVL
jgi:two-component system, chemotaxis family, chemotaxis protein CheY